MTPLRYRVPAGKQRFEEEIRRSRFITTVAYTPSVEAARDFIAATRAEFSDASHNCWAYRVGAPGSTSQIGMSDDGEPHGTAGRPMLTILEHSDIGDITAVVTRYFGGVLLGKGGLVKAYGGGVQYAVSKMATKLHIPSVMLTLVLPYSAVTPLQRMLAQYEAVVLDETYAVDVTFVLKLPVERSKALAAAVTEMTSGQALVEEEEEDS